MRMLILWLTVVQLINGAESIKVEHHTTGNLISIQNFEDSSSVQIYRFGKSSQKRGQVLLTHHRSDVITEIPKSIHVVAPQKEENLLSNTKNYLKTMSLKRFHNYEQQSTKVLVEPTKVDIWVKDGDVVVSSSIKFQVIETPGFTRGAVKINIQTPKAPGIYIITADIYSESMHFRSG